MRYVVNTEGITDEEILSEFVSSRLPLEMQEQLMVFLEKVSKPLAVRSSSSWKIHFSSRLQEYTPPTCFP